MKTDRVSGFLITPEDRAISPIRLPHWSVPGPNVNEIIELENNCISMTPCQSSRLPTGDFVFVMSKWTCGIIAGLPLWHLVMYDKHPLMGAGIVLGENGDPETTQDQLQRWVRWTDLETTGTASEAREKRIRRLNSSDRVTVPGEPFFRRRISLAEHIYELRD